ncbi:HAMP domain-containing protein [Modestobacter sp. I12A-02628]|uniref:histidine kinase n=2 Tax=Goekera deserti TaxID=2497753 RepID=A0A7K3W9Q3_9ACTN|nr:HAMP domain-containing protein [Goekera deserti]NDI49723.1 HAMP domain-containing protein [Goekera deserti]NEL53084.1 HAMP domain-containing histidine kinase [Goekera deserti]
MLSLAVVTFVTWRLLIRATDERMDAALRAEVTEFSALTLSGFDPLTGQPFTGVDAVLRSVITYNLARPNEKFLGYVDGTYRFQSRIEAPVLLSEDAAFTRLVGSVTSTQAGSYDSGAGEVLYLAVPVSLQGDPQRGVVVVAYFADQEREPAAQTARLMLGVGALTTLAAAGGAWVVAGRILRPVRDVATTAQGITETDLSGRIPVEGRASDELTDLAHSVNAMLDRVETGVAAQRRFLDDAGHELRTPITIVRGHLDVLDPADPADVRETVALVDDELDRMNRIVSDLLLLARAEQPAFVRPQPVDVAALTADVFDKVRRLGDHAWVLEDVAQVDAVLDPQRVTQALVALADNAARYTDAGGRIALGSRLSADDLRFWVADSGPGVDAGDRERVFERFARGRSGARRSDGAGLGLSIVTAIAGAHGGRVVLDSVPGRGATFTLVLPADLAPPAGDSSDTVDDATATADVPEPVGGTL